MIEKIKAYAIKPPSRDHLFDFPLSESIAKTPETAWQKFCAPALRREAYEADGFTAVEVEITIKTLPDKSEG